MPIKLVSPGGGSVTIDVPSTANTVTLTAPARTANLITSADTGTVSQAMLGSNIAGNGPVFSAYATSGTTLNNGVQTKLVFQAESFDTANCFDTSLSRFTPNVAGYYQISGGYTLVGGTNINACAIWKNGSSFYSVQVGQSAGGSGSCISGLVYLNGSTDYVELYAFQNSGTNYVTFITGIPYQWFSGALVRAA